MSRGARIASRKSLHTYRNHGKWPARWPTHGRQSTGRSHRRFKEQDVRARTRPELGTFPTFINVLDFHLLAYKYILGRTLLVCAYARYDEGLKLICRFNFRAASEQYASDACRRLAVKHVGIMANACATSEYKLHSWKCDTRRPCIANVCLKSKRWSRAIVQRERSFFNINHVSIPGVRCKRLQQPLKETPKVLIYTMSSEAKVSNTSSPAPMSEADMGGTCPPIVAGEHERHDISVRLQYLKDLDLYKTVKPVQFTPSFANIQGKTNIVLSSGELETIKDVRDRKAKLTLDGNGFIYTKAPTKVLDWNSQPTIAKDYLPEMEVLLRREIDGCDEIIFYDARIRQQTDMGVRVQGLSFNPFARQVHTDNTARSIIDKIRNLTDLKSDYLSRGRCRAINIWRPIKHPVYDCALAVADGSKLRSEDILECDRRRQDTGAYWDTMGVVKFRQGFTWYYMSEQTEDDVLLFKNYDTSTQAKARCCLHTAFDIPESMIPVNAPTRESIEVRALVFTYPAKTRPPPDMAVHHPLVDSLEQSCLMSYNTGTNFITSNARADIDEREEVRDAELLLRRQRIRELECIIQDHEHENEYLRVEHSGQAAKLKHMEDRVNAQTIELETLQMYMRDLTMQLQQRPQDSGAGNDQVPDATLDPRSNNQLRLRDEDDGAQWVQSYYGPGGENLLLRQTIEMKDQEINRLKNEVLGRATNSSTSRVWQASVSEAVRLERVKDAFLIEAMRNALVKQGGSLDNLPIVALDERQFGSKADRDDYEIRALQERLGDLLNQGSENEALRIE
nr:hypothetical protein CFP56_64021 [Quercus suber]